MFYICVSIYICVCMCIYVYIAFKCYLKNTRGRCVHVKIHLLPSSHCRVNTFRKLNRSQTYFKYLLKRKSKSLLSVKIYIDYDYFYNSHNIYSMKTFWIIVISPLSNSLWAYVYVKQFTAFNQMWICIVHWVISFFFFASILWIMFPKADYNKHI